MYRYTLVAALFTISAWSAELLEKPTLSGSSIVFVYADDLWNVPREGGQAKRLTAGGGQKTNPRFSPDGSQIAFTAEYDGNVDVFTVPATGGVPKRVTFHPSPDTVLGWTPNGARILFTSNRTSFSRFSELFTVAPGAGGIPDKLPLPMGYEGAYSPDGSHLAYVPIGRAFTAWKRYRGGEATPIWIATLASGHVEKIPREGSNDYNPMWVGDKVYFLSDRNGPVSLFSYDTHSKQVKQVLENQGLDLKSASAGPGAIVYEQFGALHLFDLKSGKSAPVSVHITGDLVETREHLVDVSKRLHNAHISPSGARAVFEARGEILTVPAEKGDIRNLTNTTAVMERDPAWSPDGKTIAYFSDESGEYQLHLAPQSGLGEVKKIRLGDQPGFYFSPRWSPDSKKIAYVDSHLTIWYIDLEQKKPVKVDKDLYWTWAGAGELTPVWSPDSKWIAYARRIKNYMAAVHVFSLADGKATQVTDGMSDCRYPAFDKDGKYLYFTSSTDAGASLEPDIHSLSRPMSRSVYVAVLSKSQASPLAPESDEEKAEKKEDSKKAAEVTVEIDFDNISQRILALPLPPRRYLGLQTGKTGVLFAIEAPTLVPGTQTGPPELTVHRFDLKTRKSDVAIGGVRSFEISQNGEKMLYRQGDKWVIAAPKPMATGKEGPPPPTPPAERWHAEDRGDSGARGSAAGMEADVSRGVAGGTGFFLRSELSRAQSRSRREKV